MELTATERKARGQKRARLPRQSPSSRDPETAAGCLQETGRFGTAELGQKETPGPRWASPLRLGSGSLIVGVRPTQGDPGKAQTRPAASVSTQKSTVRRALGAAGLYGTERGRSVERRERRAFMQPGPPQTGAVVCTDPDGRPSMAWIRFPTEPRSECALTACQRDREREAASPLRPALGRGRAAAWPRLSLEPA